MNLLKGSGVLKLVALSVALVTYFYIHNEISNTEKNKASDASYKLIKLTATKLPVKARVETAPPEGYRVLEDQIVTTPSQVTVIGPEALLDDALNAETSIIDVSEYTKTITKQVPLESVAGIHLVGNPYVVDVTVPIEKISPALEPEKPAVPEAPEQTSAQ